MSDTIDQAVDDLLTALYNETSVEEYQPTRDRVLIYPLVEKKAETEELWVPDDDKPTKGLVISAGPGILTKKGRVQPDVNPGDVVVMGGWIGEVLELNRETYRLVRAGDILMVLHEHGSSGG